MTPTDFASFLDLLRKHGDAVYGIIFAYACAHSLILTIFAGYAAHSGALDLGTLIAVCWSGSFTGDLIRFSVGRRFGTGWLGFAPRLQRAVEKAARLADRYSVWMILLHRYPYGIRNVAALAYGMSRLPWSTFLLLNVVAAGLWSGLSISAGYLFGRVSGKLLNEATTGLALALLAAFLLLCWFLSRRLDRLAERP